MVCADGVFGGKKGMAAKGKWQDGRAWKIFQKS